ncbi:MAG: hypothetical protein U0V70_07575 [Terriglobia bacterium]
MIIRSLIPLLFLLLAADTPSRAGDRLFYPGKDGPGKGRHLVLVAGDEEYRSEEALPMLAGILAERHGFDCTVLFAQDPKTGVIDPNNQTYIPGLEALDHADMLILFTRFRDLPDSAMKPIADFVNSGKPILGIRTATHAFAIGAEKPSAYARYDWRSKEWPGGFGQQVLGETWIAHHGSHGKESTRGLINPVQAHHPILKGVKALWGPTDVYRVIHLPENALVLVYGQVLEGMHPNDEPVKGPKNDPMMPLIWVRGYTGDSGKTSRIICSTMGAAVDLESEGLRRLFVNACYWGLGLESQIPNESDVRYVRDYDPTFFGFNKFKQGLKPSDFESPAPKAPSQ